MTIANAYRTFTAPRIERPGTYARRDKLIELGIRDRDALAGSDKAKSSDDTVA